MNIPPAESGGGRSYHRMLCSLKLKNGRLLCTAAESVEARDFDFPIRQGLLSGKEIVDAASPGTIDDDELLAS